MSFFSKMADSELINKLCVSAVEKRYANLDPKRRPMWLQYSCKNNYVAKIT